MEVKYVLTEAIELIACLEVGNYPGVLSGANAQRSEADVKQLLCQKHQVLSTLILIPDLL